MARGYSSAASEAKTSITKQSLDKEVWRESSPDKTRREREFKKSYPDEAARNQKLKEASDSVGKIVSEVQKVLDGINAKDYSEKNLKAVYDAGVKLVKWKMNDLSKNRDFFTPNQTTAIDLAEGSIARAANAIKIIQGGQEAVNRSNLVNSDLMAVDTIDDFKRDVPNELDNAKKMLKAALVD